MAVALQDDAVFLQRQYYNRDLALQQAARMGVTRLRVLVIWNRVPGTKANSKERAGHDPLRLVAVRQPDRRRGTPRHPSPAGPDGPGTGLGDGRSQGRRFQPNASLFGEFAAAAARHFKGRVDLYSIWNEPNYVGWLAPLRSEPQLYRALYTAAYGAIKRADPSAQVLIGETAPYQEQRRALAPLAFLRAVACRTQIYAPTQQCAPLVADGYAHHPYDFANPPAAPIRGADAARTAPWGA